MAISWDSVRALVIFLGPIIIPKALTYYRSLTSPSHSLPIRPAPPSVRVAIFSLSLLAFSLTCAALLPPFNIFSATQSRLQIPVDVLFTRLSSLRPLLPRDRALRSKFVNLESRLIYLHLGPDVLADCPFCTPDDARTYLYYALPALFSVHVANLAALAAATAVAPTWRRTAVLAAVCAAAVDVYLVTSYNYQANARALRLADIDFFYWSMRAARLLALAGLDALLATALWLSSTNRAFVRLPSPADRIDNLTRALLASRSRLNALGIVQNTVARDDDLRGRTHAYWLHEVALMRQVMEEREVVEGVNDALGRIDIRSISKDAEQYADNVLRP